MVDYIEPVGLLKRSANYSRTYNYNNNSRLSKLYANRRARIHDIKIREMYDRQFPMAFPTTSRFKITLSNRQNSSDMKKLRVAFSETHWNPNFFG